MGRKRKRRLATPEKYSKEYLPKPTTMETVLDQADAATEDRSSKILESTQPPVKKPQPWDKQPDKATTKRRPAGPSRTRGRMIWAAYSSYKSKSASVKFKSPALIPPGTTYEQEERAYATAREKAAQLLDVPKTEVLIVQAGGRGEYYDESDIAQDLP